MTIVSVTDFPRGYVRLSTRARLKSKVPHIYPMLQNARNFAGRMDIIVSGIQGHPDGASYGYYAPLQNMETMHKR